MKTPKDLTNEQQDAIGLYEASNNKLHRDKARENEPLFVNARIDSNLHYAAVEFGFTIWQSPTGLVGSKTIKDIPADAMIHAFDFVWECANEDGLFTNPDLIDALLHTLAKIQEKLAQ